MIVKPYRDRSDDLSALTELAARVDCPPRTRSDIEAEMRKIRAGQKGEKDAAYAIDFFLAQNERWAVIHDLRLEWQGRVAQIDHLLINRMLHVWLCETKHFSEGVSINEHGEFTAFHGGRPQGIASPIEQNHRHLKVLESALGSSILPLPTRLGVPLRPTLRSVVLVSARARISRPQRAFEGLDTVIKADQLRATISRVAEAMGVAETFLAAAKIVGTDTLGEFARSLAGLHRPMHFDWAARFGMPAPASAPVVVSTDPAPVVTERLSPGAVEVDTSVPRAPTGKLSTSKLARSIGLPSAGALLARFTVEGLLVEIEGGHALTEKGRAAGGEFVDRSRYGPYFIWPETLSLGALPAANGRAGVA